MESFYITLPSTASGHLYNNTQSHFRVQLPHPIELEGDWYVGLSEIHIPTAWNNVDNLTNAFKIHYSTSVQKRPYHIIKIPEFSCGGEKWEPYINVLKHVRNQIPEDFETNISLSYRMSDTHFESLSLTENGFEVEFSPSLKRMLRINEDTSMALPEGHYILEHPGYGLFLKITEPGSVEEFSVEMQIPKGLYTKVDHILQAMLDLLPKEVKDKVNFKHNRDGTLSVICGEGVSLEFPKHNHGLGSLLGFSDEQTVLTEISTGKYNIDLQAGIHGLYVYTDIINPHVVGDTHAQLLRVIPTENEAKYNYVKIYTNPDFYKLLQNRFESIEIDIRTDFGQRLQFRHGKTLVKLLFKKV